MPDEIKFEPAVSFGDAVSRNRFRVYTLIVMALIVCIAGISILPQVDLPDFTMTSAQSSMSCLVHVSASCLSATPKMHTVSFDARKAFTWVKVSVVPDGVATLPLTSLSALRC